MMPPASKHTLASCHLHVCQGHVLQTLGTLACGGSGTVAREGGTVVPTHLEQP